VFLDGDIVASPLEQGVFQIETCFLSAFTSCTFGIRLADLAYRGNNNDCMHHTLTSCRLQISVTFEVLIIRPLWLTAGEKGCLVLALTLVRGKLVIGAISIFRELHAQGNSIMIHESREEGHAAQVFVCML
jgi:hypothetical protein